MDKRKKVFYSILFLIFQFFPIAWFYFGVQSWTSDSSFVFFGFITVIVVIITLVIRGNHKDDINSWVDAFSSIFLVGDCILSGLIVFARCMVIVL